MKSQEKKTVPIFVSKQVLAVGFNRSLGLKKNLKLLFCPLANSNMSANYLKLVAMIIPNLFWVYSASQGALQSLSERREAFGSNDLYLDVNYIGIPKKGSSDTSEEMHEFEGTLATDFSEHQIHGKKIKSKGVTWYAFSVGDQKFLGWLQPGQKSCEPNLQYKIELQGKVVKSGSLKAGFCS